MCVQYKLIATSTDVHEKKWTVELSIISPGIVFNILLLYVHSFCCSLADKKEHLSKIEQNFMVKKS